MDKKVLYLLLGGAAIVGAAVAFHMIKSSDGDDGLDEDLEKLGPIELEEGTGMMKFDYFLKIFQICSFYGKTQFAAKRKDYIDQRRQALKDNDDKKYEQIVMQMTQEEEMLVQNKLMEIMDRIGISEQEFQRNTMYHGSDQMKSMQIMQMQQQALPNSQEEIEVLTREKTIETFKAQQEISMESMDSMIKDGMAGMNPQSQEGQLVMMMKMMVQQARGQDQLFLKTGVEEEQLNHSI